MNILSLFDGISCGMVALERAGILVNRYYASEIDKYAISVSTNNYPKIKQLGDVLSINYTSESLGKIDLVLGGSPCQGFSNSGDGLNFEDPRSRLFFEYIRILREVQSINPKVKFLLENVKMKNEWRDKISNYIGVEPICINSSLVSALHRERYYWTNIDVKTPIKDRNIYIKDIIEENPIDKYNLSPIAIERLNRINRRAKQNKLGYRDCITTPNMKFLNLDKNYHKGADGKRSVILNNDILRMATPLECERLQTLPDGYTEGISDSQRYQCLGNGWTVDVITHILSFI